MVYFPKVNVISPFVIDSSLKKDEVLDEIISIPPRNAFYLDDDHIEEKRSGSTTTHADFSQYDSLIFDLSINPFPPADRSDFYHEEFVGELAHIISPLEYDHFYFKIEPELGNFTIDVVRAKSSQLLSHRGFKALNESPIIFMETTHPKFGCFVISILSLP
ncbi:hypothetical protein Tco_1538487 [Tanacetum coccineum]